MATPRHGDVIQYETQLGQITAFAQRMEELPVGALLVDYRYIQELKGSGFVFQVVTRACNDQHWHGHRWMYVWDFEHLHATGRAELLNDLETIAALADEGDDTDNYTGGFYTTDPWSTIMWRVIEVGDPNLQGWLDWLDEQMEANDRSPAAS